jgi:ribosomal-protein-alanine N-acetyltransferase
MTRTPVILRDGLPSDVEAIIALDRATDSAPHWPLAAYAAILAPSEPPTRQRYLVVGEHSADEEASLKATQLAGFAVAAVDRASPPYTAELEDVIVAEQYRRTGIGRALCTAAIEWARSHNAVEVALEVRSSSTGAIALYSRLGFRETGRRPRYYRNPEDDAVLMRLRIESSHP